jgi:hypothetical protein
LSNVSLKLIHLHQQIRFTSTTTAVPNHPRTVDTTGAASHCAAKEVGPTARTLDADCLPAGRHWELLTPLPLWGDRVTEDIGVGDIGDEGERVSGRKLVQ